MRVYVCVKGVEFGWEDGRVDADADVRVCLCVQAYAWLSVGERVR